MTSQRQFFSAITLLARLIRAKKFSIIKIFEKREIIKTIESQLI